ncbi:hypothetical protein DEO72_LG2g3973 [Vigna unguiculata]|uniref:Uncharacterized protein n=1 Tax=Vigna unguiculata TaxID=3917 RepID=A0A4D6L533_VIGUN|nr:hypothetical protein DEO72_LG2g3973 [Vigna unguiculata]
MEMEQNSAPILEPVDSTTISKTKSVEYAEVPLDKQNFEASPFVIISAVLSVISAFIDMLFSILVLAAGFLTVYLNATTNWLKKTTEKLNAKGKEIESRMNRGETNNPNQDGNSKEDHRLVTSSINRCETSNSAEKRYALDNCFNNKDNGDQDYSNCEIIGCSMAKDCYNNEASGLQDLSQANLNISESENCFNNKSSKSQTYRRAKIGNPNDPDFAIRNTYNNEKNGAQNRDDYKYLPRGNIMNEHQTPN